VVLFAVAVLLRFSPSASTPLSFAVVAVAVVAVVAVAVVAVVAVAVVAVVAVAVVAVVAVAARFWRESPLSVV